MKDSTPAKKARRILLWVLLVDFALVASNLGEFWPFSIYPMFSQGGNSWSRALVREVAAEDSVRWPPVLLDDLPGRPVGVSTYGVDPIDLANFVSKTREWSTERVDALERIFFRGTPANERLLVFRVDGELTADNQVSVFAIPYVLIGAGDNLLNPGLVP